MKKIVFKKDVTLKVGYYNYEVSLNAEDEYLFYGYEAESFSGHPSVLRIEDDPEFENIKYNGEDLHGKSLLWFMSENYEIALFELPYLLEIRRKYPDCHIDLVTSIDTFLLLKQLGFSGGWIKAPFHCRFIGKYDYQFEDEFLSSPVRINEEEAKKKIEAVFGEAENVDINFSAIRQNAGKIEVPENSVGIFINSEGNTSCIPEKIYTRLSENLIKRGIEVSLLGYPQNFKARLIPGVLDYVGKQMSVLEMMEILKKLKLLIAPPSFAARFAELSKKPLFLFLSATDGKFYRRYPKMNTINSNLTCSPCSRVDRCPLGYDSCRAFSEEDLTQNDFEKLIETVSELIK